MPIALDSPNLAGKYQGALVGAAVGDALGAPFEGRPYVDPDDLERLTREPGPLRYTDDTHMTIGMAESLLAREGFDGPHMARVFAAGFSEEPWRGYGPGPPQVFRLIGQGVAWDQAGRSLFGGGGSVGNGAAMRVAPAALLAFPDMDETCSVARKTAVITHTHALGIEGAVLQACAVGLALDRDPTAPLDTWTFVEALDEHLTSPSFERTLRCLKELLEDDDRPDRDTVVDALGNGVEALRSVPTAIYAFLRNRESYRATVTYAIGLGGDTDTIACMAGAITGAYLGIDAIPERWRHSVEDSARLQALADGLLSLARVRSGRTAHP
jgi:poly(ADP-ribose) glycohydrolase ARH3